MKVKRQAYNGRPAIALIFNDYTDKLRQKLLRQKHQEEIQDARNSETFSSTISHEMRTPIGQCIFFVKVVISILSEANFPVERIPEIVSNCQLIQTQLEFLQSFVEDLLDLRLI